MNISLKTAKAKGYFSSTLNKSTISSIPLFYVLEVYSPLTICKTIPPFKCTSHTSFHSNNSKSQVLNLIFTLSSKKDNDTSTLKR